MQGRSFLSILDGRRSEDWRSSMYYRYYRSHFETEAHVGVRTPTHKLIYCHDIDEWELYDLERDPIEMQNLASDPSHRDKFNELKADLSRLQSELGDDLDNKGDHPDIGALESSPLTVNDRLLSIWRGALSILLQFRSPISGTVFARRCDSDPETMCLSLDRDGLKLHRASAEYSIDGNFTDDRWHTLALVFENQQLRAYTDGEFDLQVPAPACDDIAGSLFRFGAGFDTGQIPFQGEFDRVEFYDRPLSATSIQAFAADEDLEDALTWKWVK